MQQHDRDYRDPQLRASPGHGQDDQRRVVELRAERDEIPGVVENRPRATSVCRGALRLREHGNAGDEAEAQCDQERRSDTHQRASFLRSRRELLSPARGPTERGTLRVDVQVQDFGHVRLLQQELLPRRELVAQQEPAAFLPLPEQPLDPAAAKAFDGA